MGPRGTAARREKAPASVAHRGIADHPATAPVLADLRVKVPGAVVRPARVRASAGLRVKAPASVDRRPALPASRDRPAKAPASVGPRAKAQVRPGPVRDSADRPVFRAKAPGPGVRRARSARPATVRGPAAHPVPGRAGPWEAVRASADRREAGRDRAVPRAHRPGRVVPPVAARRAPAGLVRERAAHRVRAARRREAASAVRERRVAPAAPRGRVDRRRHQAAMRGVDRLPVHPPAARPAREAVAGTRRAACRDRAPLLGLGRRRAAESARPASVRPARDRRAWPAVRCPVVPAPAPVWVRAVLPVRAAALGWEALPRPVVRDLAAAPGRDCPAPVPRRAATARVRATARPPAPDRRAANPAAARAPSIRG